MSISLKRFAKDFIATPVALFIGKMANVEKKLDIYDGYYLTACELVDRKKLNPSMDKLLRKDKLFGDNECYVVTAVKPEKHGHKKYLKQRQFFMNKEQIETAAILPESTYSPDDLSSPKSKSVISKQEWTIETFGQYTWGWGPFRPRAQKIVPSQTSKTKRKKVEKYLERGNTIAKMQLSFQKNSGPN